MADDAPAHEPVPDPKDVATHAAPKRRRRWPWVTLAVILLVLSTALAGVLWYLSGLMGAGSQVPQPDAGFPMTITSVEGGQVSYTGVPSGWVDQGLQGVATAEGAYVQTRDPQGVTGGDNGSGTRTVSTEVLPPGLARGQAAALDGWYFPSDPKVGLGVDYQDVEYDSPLGPTPAWLIPGASSTWVVFAHGRGDLPRQGLRIAGVTSRLGYPTLLIRYRNDPQAPAGNGYAQWGADEWRDLEAAVQYALDNGAEKVVLAGLSMGGSMSLALLQNSPLADRVSGAFLDAPATDFAAKVAASAEDRGIPSLVTDVAKRVASWRYGFDWEAIDYVSDAASFTTPMLIVQGAADTSALPEVNEEFAAAASPGLVQLEMFDGAAHVSSWNTERARYEQLLADFLARVAP